MKDKQSRLPLIALTLVLAAADAPIVGSTYTLETETTAEKNDIGLVTTNSVTLQKGTQLQILKVDEPLNAAFAQSLDGVQQYTIPLKTPSKAQCEDPKPPFAENEKLPRNESPSTGTKPMPDTTPITDIARGQEILNNVLEARRDVESRARDDQKLLEEPYTKLTLPQLEEHLNTASRSISETLRQVQSADISQDGGDLAQYEKTLTNAAELAAAGAQTIAEEKTQQNLKVVQPFSGFNGPNVANPLAKTSSLAEMFGARSGIYNPTSNESLVNRALLFNGLPEEKKAEAYKKLKLAENRAVKLPSGATVNIPLLHNGYILGGGKTGLDCSSLASAALPEDVRKGQLTTLDYRMMWIYAKSKSFPHPPQYQKGRAELIQKTSQSFLPLDLYAGETLLPGDLLVHRLPWKTVGHVFIVRDYDRDRMVARVLEAAQSAGTVREREFPMSIDPPSAKLRQVRPGFLALRLKPTSNAGCSYKDKGRAKLSKEGAR